MTRRVAVAMAVALLLAPAMADAHDSRPLYVEIVGAGSGDFDVRWNVPPSVPQFGLPAVSLPEECEATRPPTKRRSYAGTLLTASYQCASDLAGKSIGISYPVINPSLSTLLRISWASGESRTVLGSPEDRVIEIPSRESAGGVASEYMRLGIRHILEGYDHLLFLACLLLVAGTVRRVLITVTGFTLAHSVTLAASTLGWVRLPIPPVEAVIALSIVFLAREIARERRNTITWRHPVAVSSSFGLLHGFGFAGVLDEVELPVDRLARALLGFNLGVEAGQLVVVAILWPALRWLAWIRGGRPYRWLLEFGTAAACGVGVFWLVQRAY